MTQKSRKRKTATEPEGFKAHYYRGGNRSTRKNASFWKTGFAVLGIGALITAVWVFGRIRTVEVNGIEDTEIETAIKKQIRQEYTFLWQPYIGSSQATPAYPNKVADVDVTAAWTEQRIIATAQPRRPALLWKTGETVFSLDERGYILRAVASPDNIDTPVIHDASNLPTEEGDRVVPRDFVEFVGRVVDSELPITRLRIIDTTSELYADLVTGYYIRFDTNASAQTQLENVSSVQQTAEKQGDTINQYIDVRLPYKAYYR